MANILRLTRYVFELKEVLIDMRKLLETIHYQQQDLLETMQNRNDVRQPERFLRTKEAAALLGVDAKTLWNWKNKGSLVPVTIGSHEYYPESALSAYRNT